MSSTSVSPMSRRMTTRSSRTGRAPGPVPPPSPISSDKLKRRFQDSTVTPESVGKKEVINAQTPEQQQAARDRAQWEYHGKDMPHGGELPRMDLVGGNEDLDEAETKRADKQKQRRKSR